MSKLVARVAAAIGATVTILAASILAAAPANADYVGARWKYPSTICVWNRASTSATRAAVYDAVWELDYKTNLRVRANGSSKCAGYSQVIIAYAGYYGDTGWSGKTYWNGYVWGKTPKGNYTWLLKSGVRIYINLSEFTPTRTNIDDTVNHELGHAVGLGHPTFSCATRSPMHGWNCRTERNYQWYDIQGSRSHPGINRIYAW